MAMGFVLIGMLAGFLAAAGAIVAGAGFGMALLAYASTGTVSVLIGGVLAALPRPTSATGMPSHA